MLRKEMKLNKLTACKEQNMEKSNARKTTKRANISNNTVTT